MGTLDLAVIVGYFLLTLTLGLWSTRGQTTSGDYFLGARNLPAWGVMLSIVATETSALTVISVPGIGARGNLTFLQIAFGYLIGRIFVAAWLLPGYFEGNQETAYARLESRFGVSTRRVISVSFLVTRFLGDGVRIFAGAIPLALVTGWEIPTAIITMGLITLAYTWYGGLKGVVIADILQLGIYLTGAIAALVIAWSLAGGAGNALSLAALSGKLQLFEFQNTFTAPYAFVGALIGGAMLSAASHGTDHLIVQRLLATRSLQAARKALIGSGLLIIAQFALFLTLGSAIWAAGLAGEELAGDQILPNFVITKLPAGLAGLMIAGILAAAMSTISSSINALASSVTNDLYAGWSGRTDPKHLFRIGRLVSLSWGIALISGALGFHWLASDSNTPVVVLALSIASVTYGVLLGTFILAGTRWKLQGPDVIKGAVVSITIMLIVIFSARLASLSGFKLLDQVSRLSWTWYVPLGTLITMGFSLTASLPRRIAGNRT